MARLYPPSISGTLPSFYGAEMTVPFLMNKVVAISEVAGFALRVKSASTETLLFEVKGPQQVGLVFTDNAAIFTLTTSQLSYFKVGEFYKVQIAYINSNRDIGYYSTVGIIKYTGAPQAWIVDFVEDIPNANPQLVIGTYSNESDPTEREAEYKFTIYANDKTTELATTGWKAHLIGTDVETAIDNNDSTFSYQLEQTDQYEIKYAMNPLSSYFLRYEIKTNNGLYKSSPLYELVENTTMDSTLLADLIAEMDYDNACVILTLQPRKKISEAVIVGTFEIGRAEEIDNYSYWTTISRFNLNGHLPQEGKVFTDFTIEQGQRYKYAIRQLNSYNIYSSWIPVTKWRVKQDNLTNDNWNNNAFVEASFEDAFLYDGKRQLRIRFNPKVSSFKTVLMDTKKTAIGNKYPYFFRNGVIAYKEFPISGLISYLSDNDQYFAARSAELGMPLDWDDTTDITDDNMIYERRFKTLVLDWLNEDNVKLYKSPGEGNFLVKLSNVSLSPNDSLSRMLHTFSCTADEVTEYKVDNLVNEGFLTVELEDENLQTLFMSYLFEKQPQEDIPEDIFQGYKGIYLKFEDFLPLSKFYLAGKQYVIGQTGQYEVYLPEPTNSLSVDYNSLQECWQAGLVPSVTYGVESKGFTSFDLVTKLNARNFTYIMKSGPNDNILEPYFDLKHQIERLYYVRFTTKELIDTNISFEALINYIEEANAMPINIAIDPHAVYRIPATDKLLKYFEDRGDIQHGDYVKDDLVYLTITGDLNRHYDLRIDKTYDTQVVYGKELKWVDDYGTKYYEDNILEFSHVSGKQISNLAYIPIDENEKPYIKIGNGIIAEFGLYQKIINYDMEINQNKVTIDNRTRFRRAKDAYDTALNKWYGTQGGLAPFRWYQDGAGYKEFVGTITQSSKNQLWNNYQTARAAYMEILQDELSKRENEAIVV